MTDHADRIDQQVGDYRLLRWLGGGGFGDVYLGEHIHEQTQAAIKILQARLTRHEDLKEFINEARTMRLKHPHIVSLLDFGIASDDTPFLVMTYAPHGTLRDRHPKGSRLPLSTIVSYVRELSSALQYAHSLHLVHRDVKPENMLVGSNYEVLLSDFGIVAVAHSSRSLSPEQGIGGTLPYMAPEQIAGKPRTASDQYALGIVVYEWIAGTRPFTGTAVEIAMQHTTASPPSLREKLPTLPVDVEQVVMRALAKDPKSRFANMEEFARALEQVSQQAETQTPIAERSWSVLSPLPVRDTISTRPPAEQANVMDRAVTNTTFSSVPATSFSGVEGMTSVTPSVDGPFTIPLPSSTASAPSRNEQPPSHLLPSASIWFRQGLRRYRYSWRTTARLLVLALLFLGSAGGLYVTVRITNARTQVTSTATAQIRNPTTIGGLTKKWTYLTGGLYYSSPAVAGGVVYIGSDDGNVYALDAASGTKKWAFPIGGSIDYSSPVVAGGMVYIGSQSSTMYALDAASGAKKWAFPTGGSTDSSPVVAGGVIYFSSNDGTMYALDAASGTKKWAFSIGGSTDSSPVVVGSVVYFSSNDYNVYALDAASGTENWAFPTGNFVPNMPTVAGGVVYFSTVDGTMYALDAASGTKKWAFPMGSAIIDSSPVVVGGVIYFGSYDGHVYALDAASGMKKWAYPTGDNISSTPAVVGGVVYIGSDGVSVKGTLYALDAVYGTKKWAFPTRGAIHSTPAVVGGVIYIGADDGNLYAFHLPTT